jgi:hypothetical protein
MLMAVVIFGIGIAIVVSAGIYNTDRFLNSPGDLRDYSDPIVTSMLFGGLLCIILSLLGCAVIAVESPALPRVYGILLIPCFFIFAIDTARFGSLVNTGDKGLQSLCSTDVYQSDTLKDNYRPYK